MRLRNQINGVLTLLLASTLLISLGAQPSVTTVATDQGPTILSGTLVDKSGDPVGRASLTVYVNEQTPDGDATWPVAEGQTNPEGKFLIRGKLDKDLAEKATVNPDGSVTLEVRAARDGEEMFFNIDARPAAPERGRPDWTFGEVVDESVLPGNAGNTPAQARAGQVLEGLQLAMRKEHSTDLMLSAAATQCRYTYHWINDTDRRRWLPLALINQRNRTWQQFLWKTTSKTKFEVVWTGGGDTWGGNLQYSHEQTTSPFLKARWEQGEGFMGHIDTRWVFQKQRQKCHEQAYSNTYGYWYDTGASWNTGKERWKAKFWEGGNRDDANGLSWYCDPGYRTVTDHEVGVDVGKTVRHAGGFSFGGYSADVTQTTAKNVNMTLGPAEPKFTRARICGRGDYYMQAKQIAEVPW